MIIELTTTQSPGDDSHALFYTFDDWGFLWGKKSDILPQTTRIHLRIGTSGWQLMSPWFSWHNYEIPTSNSVFIFWYSFFLLFRNPVSRLLCSINGSCISFCSSSAFDALCVKKKHNITRQVFQSPVSLSYEKPSSSDILCDVSYITY